MNREARNQLNADLIRLADGERASFDPVYRETWPLARGLANRMLGPGPEAEDVAQQALLKVFERANEFDPERGEALSWILGVVGWECRTARKRQSRRREDAWTADDQERAGEDLSPEERAITRDLEDALTEILGVMRPQDRETLAAAMGHVPRPGIPAATFRKRMQRAVTRLRSAWSTRHG